MPKNAKNIVTVELVKDFQAKTGKADPDSPPEAKAYSLSFQHACLHPQLAVITHSRFFAQRSTKQKTLQPQPLSISVSEDYNFSTTYAIDLYC